MKELTGKEVAASIYENIEIESKRLYEQFQHRPTLAVILVGSDPASMAYVSSKKKKALELGFGHKDISLPADIDENTLLSHIDDLNRDSEVDGILVQLPLPAHLDESKVINSIAAGKDVDGLHPTNMGHLVREEETFISCTPHGILKMLDYYEIETKGKHVVVIGRSAIVGKPIAALLMQKGRDATVTVCHSRTADLPSFTRSADILIVAIGRANFVTSDMVKDGAVVIDVGINRVDDASRKRGYRLTGDVDFDSVASKCTAITPVPRGVGPMTIAMLMYNTLSAAKLHMEGRK
ncbi:MAG: bifunctional methylenetetrahydrofolate dehydrogenase/methenyltetrahydrofolate cyclohydrolase FolD [Sphaerochaetaceae bacterium]|nr:bifunctional methylenetetrahydrofolate dehydrogenase/methenyltetrahydrofolate cyclohydrolase FolD [Sphaerochaetaceae bacterium]